MALNRRHLLVSSAKIGLVLALPGAARAADWPTRNVNIVVPFGAGGGADILGRYLAEELNREFNARFLIINKPGLSGSLGVDYASKQPADGYTFVICTVGAQITELFPVQVAALRSGQRHHSGRASLDAAEHHGGEQGRAGENGCRVRDLGEGAAAARLVRQHRLRFVERPVSRVVPARCPASRSSRSPTRARRKRRSTYRGPRHRNDRLRSLP